MKNITKIFMGLIMMAGIISALVACSSSKEVYTDITENKEIKFERSGAQLWGETCTRCHLAPSPAAYNDTDWSTIELHMRIRANISASDSNKIFEFLRSAN
jgi:cytochrome c5